MVNSNEVLWFGGTIGIVKREEPYTKEMEFYIGVGEGFDEDVDVERIVALGTKFDKQHLLSFLKY